VRRLGLGPLAKAAPALPGKAKAPQDVFPPLDAAFQPAEWAYLQ
jgi:hypothetical protein